MRLVSVTLTKDGSYTNAVVTALSGSQRYIGKGRSSSPDKAVEQGVRGITGELYQCFLEQVTIEHKATVTA